MKKLLIILGILVLLVIGVLFVPSIYNRFTKPFFKNTVDAKEWYHQVDCENLTQVKDYCDRRGYSTDYYILVDFSIPSGKRDSLSMTCSEAKSNEQLLHAWKW